MYELFRSTAVCVLSSVRSTSHVGSVQPHPDSDGALPPDWRSACALSRYTWLVRVDWSTRSIRHHDHLHPRLILQSAGRNLGSGDHCAHTSQDFQRTRTQARASKRRYSLRRPDVSTMSRYERPDRPEFFKSLPPAASQHFGCRSQYART